MTWPLRAAAILLAVVVLVHSVGGELIIFRHLGRMTGFPLMRGSQDFAKRTVRATWHVPSVLAAAFALILWRYAGAGPLGQAERAIVEIIAGSLFLSAAVIAVVTRGQHPGWVAILASAVLCAFWAMSAT
jgi:hypothetical protein